MMQRRNDARRIESARPGHLRLLRLFSCILVISLSFLGQPSFASGRGHGPECIGMTAQSADSVHLDLSGAGDSGDVSFIRFHSTCSAGACVPLGLRDGFIPVVVRARNTDLYVTSTWDDPAGRPVAPAYRPPISV